MPDVFINGVRYRPASGGVVKGDTDSFATIIKVKRKMCGFTLEELAADAGISKSTAWEIENGAIPSFLVTAKVAAALGIDVRALAQAVLYAEAAKEAKVRDHL